MKIHVTWVALLILLGIGCKEKDQSQVILSESEMVNFLMEMYIAESKFEKLSLPLDSLVALTPIFAERVFEREGVSREVYRKSMEHYLANPKQMERIYSALVDSLSFREQSAPHEYTQYAAPK